MSEVLRSGTQLIRNIRRNRNRKSLQVLQPSADNYNLLVPSPIMVNRAGKEVTKSNTFKIPENDCTEKENSSVVRRSKRKNAFLDGQPETEPSKEDVISISSKNQKPKVSKAVSKNKKAPVTKKSEKKVPDLNQSNLDSFVSVASKSIEQGESSKNIVDSTFATADRTIRVFKSVSEEVDLLTSDEPSETYWKEIAEQRRLALEKTLYENAQLVDQLEVLEVENGQLKSALKEFEKVIEAVNASL